MPRSIDQREVLRLVRKPLILALKRAAACKDCYPDVRIEWRMSRQRLFELDVRMQPCFVHSVEITAAMNETERKVVKR